MRGARLLLPILAALAVSACARQQPAYYVIDPNTGQPVPVVAQQPLAQPQYPQPSYGQPQYVQQPQYAPPQYAQQQQTYAAPAYQPPVASPRAASTGQRGLFTSRPRAPQAYAQQPYAVPPQYAAPQGGPYVAAQNAYASATYAPAYTLDSGDRLRVVVFGQDGITNGYTVDAGGNVNLPLVGTVPARGYSTQQLSQMIAERLKQGYVREPHVTVEVEAYRPFFILGEVTTPGQYPYVANMTAETAIAIAGGFAPRASKSTVKLTRNAPGQQINGDVPLNTPLRPGDTIVVKERWF